MKLGFIGYGEASFEMSYGLQEEGLEHIVAFDPLWEDKKFGPLIQERANKAGVNLKKTSTELIQNVDIIIVAVPANQALNVCESILSDIDEKRIYVDVSAATPDTKLELSRLTSDKGVYFVDVAMMGSLPMYKHKVPILASGNGAHIFSQELSRYGMNIEVVSAQAGEASAVKLIRSIFMKGLPCLLIEMLEAARLYNVDDLVIKSISETMDSKPFYETMNRLVTGTSIHAERRSVELLGTMQMLKSKGLNFKMSNASYETLADISNKGYKEMFDGKTPEIWKSVIGI